MAFRHGAWYQVPDGTRVQAVLTAQYWLFQVAVDTPLVLVTARTVYHFTEDPGTRVMRIAPAAFDPDDVIPVKHQPDDSRYVAGEQV